MPKSGSIFTDPTVAVFYPCINCRRLLAYHVDQCPHCREMIDPEQKKALAIHSILHTSGISLANTIASGDIGVVLLSLFAIWAWWGGYQPLVAGYVVLGAFVTAAILRWNRRYDRLPFDDDEFNASRREMSRSLMIWIAFTSFAAIVFSSFWF